MPDKPILSGLLLGRKKYTPAFRAGYIPPFPRPSAYPNWPQCLRTTVADSGAIVAENLLIGLPTSIAPNQA